jgi:hypothetical protein
MRRVSPRDPPPDKGADRSAERTADRIEKSDPRAKALEERSDAFGHRLVDFYEDSAVQTDPRGRPLTETAPELSSAFHERAFIPRGTMAADELLAGLREPLGVLGLGIDALLAAWQPYLRQAVEQVAGDGVDALVSRLRKPPGKAALYPFMAALLEEVTALHRAAPEERLAAAERVIALVEAALAKPMRVSLRALERDLEGHVDLETVLATLFASSGALDQQERRLTGTLESLRAQLKQIPGKQPEGMLWNFTRLKAELALIALERKRRG